MSAAPSLLSAAVRKLSRSAHGVVVSPARGFQVFRVDGYSWSKTIPAGVNITSGQFTVGGRKWLIDYYPNGTCTDVARETDSISLYLRLAAGYEKELVRAQYKFSVLDHSGVAAYELPPVTSTFTSAGRVYGHHVHADAETGTNNVGVGLALSKEELERRSETLLKNDCLAIRCDVGVTELAVLAIEPKQSHNTKQDDDDDDSDWEDGATHESHRRRRQPLDDAEYIRRCLAKNRRT